MDTRKQVHIYFFFLATCSDATQPKAMSKGSARRQVSRLSVDAIAWRHERINASDSKLSFAKVAEEGFGGDKKPKE